MLGGLGVESGKSYANSAWVVDNRVCAMEFGVYGFNSVLYPELRGLGFQLVNRLTLYLQLLPALGGSLDRPWVNMPCLTPARVPPIRLVRAVNIEEREVITVLDCVMSLRGPLEALLVRHEYVRYLQSTAPMVNTGNIHPSPACGERRATG